MNAATPQTEPQQTSWTDAMEASAQQTTREIVNDVIEVKLGDADLVDIARSNAADDEERDTLQKELDALKEKVKEKKVGIEAVVQRMRDRNNSVRRGTVSRKGEWIVESCFQQNTVRYLDPKTERVVFERPMEAGERQTELALGEPERKVDAVEDGLAADAAAVTDPEQLLKAAQEGEATDEDEDFDLENDDEDDS